MNVDSEDAVFEEIEINQIPVQLYIKGDDISAVWEANDGTFFAAGNVAKEEFIRFLEGLEAKA